VLPVGVDGEHLVVGRDAPGPEPGGEVGEGLVVGGRHPPVLVEGEECGAGRCRQPLLDDLAGVVGRAVVDHHQLVDEGVEPVEHRFDRRLLVVGGDDGDPPPLRSRSLSAHVQAR